MDGVGVLINRLGGNRDTVEAVQAALGQKIASVTVKDDVLSLTLKNGNRLELRDNGQSCCEHRYMVCDDDLSYFTNTVLKDIELRDAPSVTGVYDGEHETQFLVVTTGKGRFTVSNHNEHNGYYGGFSIAANLVEKEDQ